MSSGLNAVPTDARTLQVRVADEIRIQIQQGVLVPGDQLPTLDQLCDRHQVSMAVARAALDLLRQQGLVVTRQGRGSFVREQPTAVRYRVSRYARQAWRSGESPWTVEAARQGHTATHLDREWARIPAPRAVAACLAIAVGQDVWVHRSTVLLDGQPAQLVDVYHRPTAAGAAPERGRTDTLAALEDTGHHPDSFDEQVVARMPTSPESALLHIPAGTPVIEMTTTVYDVAERPLAVTVAVLTGHRAHLAYRFKIPD